jgi:hypothetical protein
VFGNRLAIAKRASSLVPYGSRGWSLSLVQRRCRMSCSLGVHLAMLASLTSREESIARVASGRPLFFLGCAFARETCVFPNLVDDLHESVRGSAAFKPPSQCCSELRFCKVHRFLPNLGREPYHKARPPRRVRHTVFAGAYLALEPGLDRSAFRCSGVICSTIPMNCCVCSSRICAPS